MRLFDALGGSRRFYFILTPCWHKMFAHSRLEGRGRDNRAGGAIGITSMTLIAELFTYDALPGSARCERGLDAAMRTGIASTTGTISETERARNEVARAARR